MTYEPILSDDSLRRLRNLSPAQRTAFIRSLPDEAVAALHYEWRLHARPEQILPDGNWRYWLLIAGRGFGKTRTGAEATRDKQADGIELMLLIGRTSDEVRDLMIEGPAGILAVSPQWNKPTYQAHKRRVVWPNGAVATLRSADEPDSIRGQNAQWVWADEVSSWKYTEAFDNANMGLRIPPHAQGVVTTTPKANSITKMLLTKFASESVITRGKTSDNRYNLDPATLTSLLAQYEGTRMGRQELDGEFLEDIDGALWSESMFSDHRISSAPPLSRIVVAVDPAASSTDESNETGIVGMGVAATRHRYVLADKSMRGKPNEWARAAIDLYEALNADCIVAEKNNGGEMVTEVITAAATAMKKRVRIKTVWASRGKSTRAEPTVAAYERGEIHHVGIFGKLESQLCMMTANGFQDKGSPDRMDALVWADAELSGAIAQPVLPVSSTRAAPLAGV